MKNLNENTSKNLYALFYKNEYFVSVSRTSKNINDACKMTKEEGVKLMSKIMGSQLHIIK